MTNQPHFNSKIRSIVVDDEQPAQVALVNYIKEYCLEIEVVAVCNSAESAFKAIVEHKPQLVFLDIEMPKASGFDLLRMFNPIHFKVIFVTAFSQYAIDAFRYSAVDYLMKPVKISELVEAISRVQTELKSIVNYDQLLDLLENFSTTSRQNKNLILSDAKGFSVVKTDDIIMCKADGYCTTVYMTNNESATCTRNLKYYEEILDSRQFMRVHNSYIINLNHVKRYGCQEEIFLTDNLKCSLSRVHKHEFQEYYKNKSC